MTARLPAGREAPVPEYAGIVLFSVSMADIDLQKLELEGLLFEYMSRTSRIEAHGNQQQSNFLFFLTVVKTGLDLR
ncbi:hypothetical protein AB4Z32_09425 [Massilia sp. 2TAF26]|uniref:hypothetical protein n=1 Tax=Massilia sp. 2TAF26 TaxID=3233012 RepID=UPI003F9E7883